MALIFLLVICISLIVPVAVAYFVLKESRGKNPWDENIYCSTRTPGLIDYTLAYQRRPLLTPFEHQEFRVLATAANKYGLLICPKVRLLDLIEPRHNRPTYISLLNKVKSKHVDFVLCDRNLNVVAIIELDDPSHNRPDRIERDKFVDQILRSVGYKIVHVQTIQPNIIEMIYNNQINN